MASWNSFPLEITYETFGWLAFFSWSISFYPQVILNFRRKSVIGLNFDFVLLNLTKHSSYMIYNVCLYFSPVIQQQYFDEYGSGEMIPVAANDVAFSIHAVLLTAITLFQIVIYERGTQKVSKISIGIVSVVWLIAAICFFVALPSQSWLWLISIFNSIQVFMTVIKYIPQAVMNFMRKSTDGFSIGNILLDFTGGLANYAQMVVQSIDQNSWVNFYGNIGKTLLSLVSIFFDIIFMCQHYVLYPVRKATVPSKLEREDREPLIKSIDESASEQVPKMTREARRSWYGSDLSGPTISMEPRTGNPTHSKTQYCPGFQIILQVYRKMWEVSLGPVSFHSGFSVTGDLEFLDSFNEDEINDPNVNDHDDVNENCGTRVLIEDDDFMGKLWSLHDKQNDNDNDNNEDEDDHMTSS
ncbi:hypothetical protein V6N13_021128 [Hibiscus sabdariffa]|uniref:Cystinosin homolog n=2 Tax=Hibiscus sabdariffa TaxID=183260 RepID=A0ABR2EVI7_9ROSI